MARIIALVGGGTMGPTAPLLALYKKLHELHPHDKFVRAGTPEGPERQPVEELHIPFVSIPVAKFPRYFSKTLFTWPFDYLKARNAAREFVDKWKPDLVIGAGGFTQVPIIRYAAQKNIPCLIHQLDFLPSLSNVSVADKCKLITTTFTYHYKKFRSKADEIPIATPNRFADVQLPEKSAAVQHFGLTITKPVVLVVGGSTGSRALNTVLENDLDNWCECRQIIHITGKGRSDGSQKYPGYVRREFMNKDELILAYAAADIVISRAGMGAITDFAALSKPCVLVPIPHSHQEKNTRHLGHSVIEVKQGENFYQDLNRAVRKLLRNPDEQRRLARELHQLIKTDDGTQWAGLVERFLPEEID